MKISKKDKEDILKCVRCHGYEPMVGTSFCLAHSDDDNAGCSGCLSFHSCKTLIIILKIHELGGLLAEGLGTENDLYKKAQNYLQTIAGRVLASDFRSGPKYQQ